MPEWMLKRSIRPFVAPFVLVSWAFVCVTTRAAPLATPPTLTPAPIIDPNHSLTGFYQALSRTQAAHGAEGITRVLYIGDSAVVGDGLTGALRRILQRRYGDAGAGFLMVGKPWPWYRHRDVRHDGSGWQYEGVHNKLNARERLYGLSYLRAFASGKGAHATFATSKDQGFGQAVSRFEGFYLEVPHGGSFTLQVDGGPARTVATKGTVRRAGYVSVDVPDGAHELSLEAVGGGPVRVYGVAMERARPGVVLDAIGINGAHATHLVGNDRMLRDHLVHRKPDLIAIQLGTNLKSRMPVANYANEMRQILTFMRATVPTASCLVVTPFDRTTVPVVESEPTPPYIPKVVEALKSVAHDTGCAYWSAYDTMGGKGSFRRWQRLGFANYDGMHLGHEGYDALAESFANVLLPGAH
jgi:lysophospholipase L1-like esterase